jgi:membrane fusion protein, heavy metal efflux system
MKRIVIAYIVVGSLIASCGAQHAEQPETKSEVKTQVVDDEVTLSPVQIKNAGIVTGNAIKHQLSHIIKAAGSMDVPPNHIVSVSVPFGGYVKKIDLLPGQYVRKRTTLATLEDQQYVQLQQDYLTAQIKVSLTKVEYQRQLQLNENKAASDKVLQQANADYEEQKVLLKSVGEKLRLIGIDPLALNVNNISRVISLRAPIDGYVTKVGAHTGGYINATDIVAELVDPKELHLSLIIFEQDAASIRSGQKVVCFSNVHPDVKYMATVHLVNPSIGKDRSVEVHCDLDKPAKELLPGMYMNAEIRIENNDAMALPEDAVVSWNNKSYIFHESIPGKYKMVEVKTGIADGGYVEIIGELPQSNIVLENAYILLTKLKNGGED